MSDLELLRKYEPVARFTKGEAFFPIAVDEYLKECSLWLTDPQKIDQMLVPSGQLDAGRLVGFDEIPTDHKMHLRFVENPLDGLQYQVWLRDPKRERFTAPGRLLRVPLFFRLADALFDLSFLVRGQVPGGYAAAADLKNREISRRDPRRVYYGRVVRSADWIALHYLYFYSMNNWRSSFFGVNDHEADWEQAFVFLAESETGEPEPHWVAYASHDFKGDDRRRRWDDPLLVKEGNHPVLFVGAGSHAGYFEQGEYLMGAEPEFLQPLKGALDWARKFWNESLGMGSVAPVEQGIRARLSVPFIDYARGDGMNIGPGCEETWDPEIISDEIGWVHNYRGLWGLDTHDPIGGERAPAGPKYNRDGSVRQSWYDPIGWAGLGKVLPPAKLRREIGARLVSLQSELSELDLEIEKGRGALRRQAMDVEALEVTEYFSGLQKKKEIELQEAQNSVETLLAHQAELVQTQQALESFARRVDRGELGPSTRHLRQVQHPQPPLGRQYRLVEIWAALSGAVILLVIVGLLISRPAYLLLWLLGLGVGLRGVEALSRGELINYLLSITIVLAVIGAVILIVEFWFWALILVLVGIVIFMIRGNLLELRR